MLRLNRQPVKGQSLLEYSIILGVIVLIIFTMTPTIRRLTQGLIKVMVDQIGSQQNAEQRFDDRGHLDSSKVDVRFSSSRETRENFGLINYISVERTETDSSSFLNLGTTRQN